MVLKSLKQQDILEEKFITMNLHYKMQLKNIQSLKTILINLKNLGNQKSQTKPTKLLTLEYAHSLFKGREKVLNGFESEIFSIKTRHKEKNILQTNVMTMSLNLRYHTQLKILTPKQIFQRLPIALAKVKAGNTSENLLNQIRQFIYSLYRAKEITK